MDATVTPQVMTEAQFNAFIDTQGRRADIMQLNRLETERAGVVRQAWYQAISTVEQRNVRRRLMYQHHKVMKRLGGHRSQSE